MKNMKQCKYDFYGKCGIGNNNGKTDCLLCILDDLAIALNHDEISMAQTHFNSLTMLLIERGLIKMEGYVYQPK